MATPSRIHQLRPLQGMGLIHESHNRQLGQRAATFHDRTPAFRTARDELGDLFIGWSAISKEASIFSNLCSQPYACFSSPTLEKPVIVTSYPDEAQTDDYWLAVIFLIAGRRRPMLDVICGKLRFGSDSVRNPLSKQTSRPVPFRASTLHSHHDWLIHAFDIQSEGRRMSCWLLVLPESRC